MEKLSKFKRLTMLGFDPALVASEPAFWNAKILKRLKHLELCDQIENAGTCVVAASALPLLETLTFTDKPRSDKSPAATFALTILGTFLTRSGVVNSVHSFSLSAIGPLLLGYLVAILVLSVGLLLWRSARLRDAGPIGDLIEVHEAQALGEDAAHDPGDDVADDQDDQGANHLGNVQQHLIQERQQRVAYRV